MVQPSLTSREENSMFVDTLPSPYYDTLVVNAFVEFGDLMYSVGRIKDGIKREKIADTGASMMEKKRIVPDEHVQAMFGEKEDHIRHGRSLSRIIHVHQGMPKSLLSISSRPKGSHWNTIKGLTQAITRARKGKGPKCTIHFQCLIQSCSPY